MATEAKNYDAEIRLLRDFEYGELYEPYTRLVAVSIAGVLIHLYTGWTMALVWPVLFLASYAAYFYYVSSRSNFVHRSEATRAAILLSTTHIAFSWLPTLMLIGPNRALMFVGGMLIAAQMLFLAQRNDTMRVFNVCIVALVSSITATLFIGFMPAFDTPLALFGAATSALAMVYYFIRTMRVTRQIRQSRETAALQAHQAQKMAAVGQLAGGVAHDFNNNLTAIIGSLELIQITDDPVERAADVENALVAARQAAKTVRQLTIFARAERPDIAEIYLSDLYAELRILTQRLVPTSVTFNIHEIDPTIKVNADRSQLVAGLINLIVNAVDSMPLGGHLSVRADQVTTTQQVPLADGSALDPGAHVQIVVKDTGHGIPETILPKVIDPFFTTKPVGKGTGLGLSMVAGMLKELKGGMAIQSSHSGTQISLFLPDLDARSQKQSSVAP